MGSGGPFRFTELVVPAVEVDAIDRRTFGLHHAAAQLHVTAITDQTGAPLQWQSVDTGALAPPLPVKVKAEPPVVVPAKQPTDGGEEKTSAAAAEPAAPQPAENGGGGETAAVEATPLPDGEGTSGAVEATSLLNGEGSSAAAAEPTPQPASAGNDAAAPTPPAPPATYQARGTSRAPHHIHPPVHILFLTLTSLQSCARLGDCGTRASLGR
jgi:hypothetical protein